MKGLARARRRIRRLAVLAAAVGTLAAFPGIATAATCDYDGSGGVLPDKALVDSMGFSWDLGAAHAGVGDGYHNGSGRTDAFDTMAELRVSTDSGATFKEYTNPDAMGCEIQDGGREVVYPTDTTTAPNVALTRQVYVPDTGLAFGRWIDTFTNTGNAPATFIMRFGGNLGSDGNEQIGATSSGDGVFSEADSWVNIADSPITDSSDPTVTFVWDGTAPPQQRALQAGNFYVYAQGYDPSSEDMMVEYPVTLAPGETKRFMHVLALRLNAKDQAEAATAIAAEPESLLAGLAEGEQTFANWAFDADSDGLRNAADNCRDAANSDQADLDGDGKGDVCDDDTDGDGLANTLENSLRTDVRNADTDGDGKADNGDSCPTIAGADADGCPAPVNPVVVTGDDTPPASSVAVARAISLKALLRKGFTARVNSNEPASFTFEVLAVSVRGARLARVGDLVVGTKRLALGSGKRSARLGIAKKFRKAIRLRTRLVLRTVATDTSGNRTTTTKRLRLKK